MYTVCVAGAIYHVGYTTVLHINYWNNICIFVTKMYKKGVNVFKSSAPLMVLLNAKKY